MDDSWLAKCVAPPPPLPPFPAPASTPTVPPQQLPFSPASAGQVSMILRHRFPSFLAQEALLKDQARSQETSASDTLNLSSYRLGKTELGNSFLSLLSGKFSQLPNSRMDIAKPQVSNDDKILSGSGCVVPSINIPPLPENHGDNAPENWNELSSFVASRPSVNSASLHNSAQVAGNSYHDMDSIELVSQQSSKPIRGLPTTGRYRQSEQFLPRYHSKSTGNNRFRPLAVDFGWYQKKREKKSENLESDAALPIPIRRPRVISSPPVGRRNVSLCGEKERGDVASV
ncbi:hypothetical protein BHM03_00010463, partial [Ensete ventricosum]